MQDFITQLLAKWLDKFKTSNPRIFLLVQFILVMAEVGMIKGIDMGVFGASTITDAITVAIPIVMGIVGTRTVQHMPEANQAKLKAEADGYKAYHPKGAMRAMSANPSYLD